MRNIFLTTVAISALTLGAAHAQEAATTPGNAPAADRQIEGEADLTTSSTAADTDSSVGAIAGGAAGAAAGTVIAGPIGAVVGGIAGAVLGNVATIPEPAVDYVVAHPVEPVVLDADVAAGYVVPQDVAVTPIPDYPEYGYVYVDGRPIIVRLEAREVVYSPGYAIPERTVTYVQANPLDPVDLAAEVRVGAAVPAGVTLVPVPSDPAYSYVYTENGPVLVNNSTRTIVWVRG